MKRTLIAAAAATVLWHASAHAQIPTVDLGAITQIKEQIEEARRQYKALRDQFDSLHGSRGMTALLQNPALRKYLPPEWRAVYDQAQNGQYSGLNGAVNAIKSANAVLSADELQSKRASTAETINRQRNYDAVAQATAEEAYRRSSERIDYLQTLADRLQTTDDPKDVMDLQAAIASEQSMLQNEQIRLQLVAQLQAIEQQQEQRRQREEFLRTSGPNPVRIR